jgi:hypothetical protein
MFRIRDNLISDPDPILGSSHWITDPDPPLFGNGFQDANKKMSFLKVFLAYFLMKVH